MHLFCNCDQQKPAPGVQEPIMTDLGYVVPAHGAGVARFLHVEPPGDALAVEPRRRVLVWYV